MKRQHDSSLTLPVDASMAESVNVDTNAVGARMKAARNALGMTQDQLAALAGSTSKRGVQDNEAGKSMPGGQMIGALTVAGINANWLLTGEGPMLLRQLVIVDEAHPTKAAPFDIDLMRALLEMVEEELEKRDLELPPKNKARVLALMYDYMAASGTADAGVLRNILDLAA